VWLGLDIQFLAKGYPLRQIRTEAKAHLPAASRLASAAKPTVPHFATKRKTSVLLEYHLVEKTQNLGAT
jgi:hypothetical protein